MACLLLTNFTFCDLKDQFHDILILLDIYKQNDYIVSRGFKKYFNVCCTVFILITLRCSQNSISVYKTT